MWRKLIAISLFLGLSYQSIADAVEPDSSNYFGFHCMPFSMIDPRPRLRVGFENLNDKNAFSLDFGYGDYKFNRPISGLYDLSLYYRFFEIRAEYKYYYKRTQKVFNYIGFELFYLQQKDYLENSNYYSSDQSGYFLFSSADFKKEKLGAHFKFGFNIIISQALNVDLYAGGGLAIRNIEYSNVNDRQLLNNQSFYFSASSKINQYEGALIIPHLTMGLKFGFLLKKQEY